MNLKDMLISFMSFIAIYMKCHDVCFLCTELNTNSEGTITTTRTVPVSSSTQPTNSDGAITTTILVSNSTQPTNSDGAITTTILVSNSTQPTNSDGAITTTILVSNSTQPTNSDGAITTTILVSNSTQPTNSDGAITTTILVSNSTQPTNSDGTITTTILISSSTQPTNSDGATTLVIIVVAVVIIVVVIVVGVVILVVIFRAKKRKQQLLVINKLLRVTTEKENIEIELKHEGAIEKEDNSSTFLPPHAEIQTEAPPNVPSKSEDLVNLNSPLTVGYSEIELEPDDSKQALPAKPPRHVTLSDPTPKAKDPNPMYQNMNQHHDTPSTTDVSQDIYTVPDTTSSHTVDHDSSLYETVYNEPIQPSLFTDAVETPSDCEDLHPYAPIYTVPMNLPVSKHLLLKVYGSNIREIRELGKGLFGKVILAETVGLSAKDLRLSESDDDKSKSILVAVKKLKSDASTATKEAFEKEVNFMLKLTDRNVIRILGVCYEDTPFIMMEYMEKGDLNQYLQKFKTLSTTDSEPHGQITTSTLVNISTQIASAMKYLASHNYVHRDLAT